MHNRVYLCSSVSRGQGVTARRILVGPYVGPILGLHAKCRDTAEIQSSNFKVRNNSTSKVVYA